LSDLFGEIGDFLNSPEFEIDRDSKRGFAIGMKAGAEAIFEAVKRGEDINAFYAAFVRCVDEWSRQQRELELGEDED
jgi:hypothetical protein